MKNTDPVRIAERDALIGYSEGVKNGSIVPGAYTVGDAPHAPEATESGMTFGSDIIDGKFYTFRKF